MTKFKVGDEVRYTALFLRSTGQQVGRAGFRKGKVLEVGVEGMAEFVKVDWNDTGEGIVNAFNICHLKSRASYAD